MGDTRYFRTLNIMKKTGHRRVPEYSYVFVFCIPYRDGQRATLEMHIVAVLESLGGMARNAQKHTIDVCRTKTTTPLAETTRALSGREPT